MGVAGLAATTLCRTLAVLWLFSCGCGFDEDEIDGDLLNSDERSAS